MEETMQRILYYLLYIITIATQIICTSIEKYCNIGCKEPNKTHGVCVNPEKKLIESCPGSAEIILMSAYQHIILNAHNEKRQLLASGEFPKLPPASRMGEMFWDKELAELAEYSARRCLIKDPNCYETPLHSTPGRSANNLKVKDPDITYEDCFTQQINIWMDTSENVTPEMVANFPADTQEHQDFFGRAILEKNNQVGCAAARWTSPVRKVEYILLVCLYPYDVEVGKRLYKIGHSGSRCSKGKSKEYENLCSVKENYTANDDGHKTKVLSKGDKRARPKRKYDGPEGGLWTLMVK